MPPIGLAQLLHLLLTLVWVRRAGGQSTNTTPNFWSSAMSFSPCCTTANSVGVALQITFSFYMSYALAAGDTITVALPRFYAGGNIAAANFYVSPSLKWTGVWTEGTYVNTEPYPTSNVVLTVSAGASFTAAQKVTIILEEGNNIKAFCGIGPSWSSITIATTTALGSIAATKFAAVSQLGDSCGDCYLNRGVCNYCFQSCDCYEGFGDATLDNVPDKGIRSGCLELTCPKGAAWFNAALFQSSTLASTAHSSLECSGQGTCDRTSGNCKCFDGFDGEACERTMCPNNCSGHGKCLTLEQLAKQSDALPLSAVTTYGAVGTSNPTTTWDHEGFSACVCDSSWTVGLASGQVQTPEYFGVDCSLRHCPTGNNPATLYTDETSCSSTLAAGGRGTGATGNICHLDCSGQGLCDFATGLCACFDGYYGDNCGNRDAFATYNRI